MMGSTRGGQLAPFQDRLDHLRRRHLYRELHPVAAGADPWVELDGRRLLNLSSNNYLGLAGHPDVRAGAAAAALAEGCGTGSSRLISGTTDLHRVLEERLARFKGAEAALLFNSGYTANIGVIPALVGARDLVLGDELNHASLIDGCRLSRAEYRTYPHGDTAALEALLAAWAHGTHAGRCLVVTETVFSMDGDLAPLAEIARLSTAYGALLYVDEAHATGCIGPGGRGLVAELGLEDEVTIAMSTLSKALGGFGAFVVGSQTLIDYLINVARSFLFTTSLPAPVVAGSLAALEILEREERLAVGLQGNAEALRRGLRALGFDVLASATQIVPVFVGGAERALEVAAALRQEGVFVVAIRPPTVPAGAARIRCSVMATHTAADIEFALEAFRRVGERLGLLPPPSAPTEQPPSLTLPRKGGGDTERDDKRFLWHPFTPQEEWEHEEQVVIERAEGCFLIDSAGNRYLDGVSSLWVNVHGHRRTEINRAIAAQLERIAHSTFLGLTHAPGTELARRLVGLAPRSLSRVFYSETGAAAVEIALKMAFQYWQQCDDPRPGKTKFFSLTNAYHGDTVGAMSVGGIELFRQTYRPLLFPTYQAPSAYCYRCHLGRTYPACQLACLEEVERVIARHADELAGIIVEPLVQGAAGMLVFPPGYTRAVWEIARRHDVLFIADEVATGFGRTGTLFACEQEEIEPDLMAVGKGITGGYLPLAATLASEAIYKAFLGPVEAARTFYHGHTYTGNPVACAAALASLDLFEQDRTLAHLPGKIAWLRDRLERLRELPLVGDVRQCGFMVGIELVRDRDTRAEFPIGDRVAVRVIKEARRRGAILRPLSDVVVLMPPLAISNEELASLVDIVEASIQTVGAELTPSRSGRGWG